MSSFDKAFGSSPAAGGATRPQRPTQPELADVHCLVVQDPTGTQQAYAMQSTITVGSDASSAITLQDPSLAPGHIALDTDGTKFWFRAMDPSATILLNGQATAEGWLNGGEEIQVGSSKIYFFGPAPAAPPTPSGGLVPPDFSSMSSSSSESDDPFGSMGPKISAPLDFDDFARKSAEAENKLAEAAALLDQPVNMSSSSSTGYQKSKLGLFLIIGMYILQAVVLYIGIDVYRMKHLSPAKAAAATDNPQQTFQNIVKLKTLVDQKQFRKADQLAQQTLSQTSKSSPMLPVLNERVKQIKEEIVHLDALKRSRGLVEADKWVDALPLLGQIPKERHAYAAGKALRAKIFVDKVKPLMKTVELQIESRKFEEARSNINKILTYDGNLAEAVDLQQKLEKADPEGSRRANAAALKKFEAGFKLFRSNQYEEAAKYFKELESKAAGLIKRKAGSYQRQIANFVEILDKGIKASKQGNHDRAAVLLLRVHKLSKTMGGSSSKYGRRLALAFYKKGQRAWMKKQYPRSLRFHKRALNYYKGYGPSRRAIRMIQSKARSLYKQAMILKGVDNREARRLLRQVIQIAPRSSSLYRNARRNMR
ncbi:MAG: hypothetical protein EP343_31655 [Deltaproteobacteria bacterium]|nr:MAG: hypothetical protein EP343_31655 [Deltaproteobacteria bacterium]